MPKIYSDITIGTVLDINLRSNLSFVTFTENIGSTDVHIDSYCLDNGVYDLNLQSFNKLSKAKSTLKADNITISVSLDGNSPTCVYPHFVEELTV